MRAGTLELPRTLSMRDVAVLTKSGITMMVVVSTAVGILLAADGPLPLDLWVHTLIGTGLVAAGASALNQVWERDLDALMRRTAERPIPAGRVHPDLALSLGVGLAILGLVELAALVDVFAALLAAVTLGAYVFLYTPLKRVHSLATVVGAVPGAMPPVIGWAAVTGGLEPGAWVLFGLLFFWQMPHFLAIAWIYRADYERGGFPMLTVGDPEGLRTSRLALFYCAALVPVSLLPSVFGLAGPVYFVGALLLGLAFLAATGAFAWERSTRNARRLMFASILYLPLVLAVLVVDRVF